MNVGTRVNFLPETLWTSSEGVAGGHKTLRSQDLHASPGIRWAHRLKGGRQFVPGIATPSESLGYAGQRGVTFYRSFEPPLAVAFARAKSKDEDSR